MGDTPSTAQGNSPLCLRIRPLLPLVCNGQVPAALHQDVEGTSFVDVVDVEEDLTADLHTAIVTGLTVHTGHAVNARLQGNRKRDQRLTHITRSQNLLLLFLFFPLIKLQPCNIVTFFSACYGNQYITEHNCHDLM